MPDASHGVEVEIICNAWPQLCYNVCAKDHISWEDIMKRRNLVIGMRTIGICLAASTFVLGMTASVSAQNTPPQANNVLVLKKQGTFYVGGTIEFRSPNSSTTVTGDIRSLPGNIAVHQMYVEYQVPNVLKYKYPIVFMHGGGHTGEFFRTTPDGRDGWFTSFTKRGFAVYSVDGSNRGRAGGRGRQRREASDLDAEDR